jgi:hypothetical protein
MVKVLLFAGGQVQGGIRLIFAAIEKFIYPKLTIFGLCLLAESWC